MSENKWEAGIGKLGRVIAARIKPGEDAINSIIEIIKEYGFKSGTVIGIGSFNSAEIIRDCTFDLSTDLTRSIEEICGPYPIEKPVFLGIGWGMFGTEEGGNIILHFHAIASDREGKMCCGNLQPGSAPIMTTLDVRIQELVDIEIKPSLDPVLKVKLLNPTNMV